MTLALPAPAAQGEAQPRLSLSRYPRLELAQNQLATADMLRAVVRRMPAAELREAAEDICGDLLLEPIHLVQALSAWAEPRPGELERAAPELEEPEPPVTPALPPGPPAPPQMGPPIIDPALAADRHPEQ